MVTGRKLHAPRCLRPKGDHTVLLFRGWPLSLPFRGRPLFLCGEAPTVGAAGGFGRPAGGSFGGKTLGQEVGGLGEGDLTIA